MKRCVWTIGLVAMLGLGLASAGCSDQKVTSWSVFTNMSPELGTLTRSNGQDAMDNARVFDNNLRAARDDFQRLWLLDHSSTLHPYPIP